MEPVDDILLPPAQPQRTTRRLSSKHVLRTLAVILMASALAYVGKVLKLDSERLVTHSKDDLLAVAPIFLFGVILWWYAGRKVAELSRPLFRAPGDSATEARVDMRNFFWLGASLISGVVGLGAIIVGMTFLRFGKDLRMAMPDFFEKLEQSMPQVQKLEVTPAPVITAGILLVVIAILALVLAMRRRTPTA